MRVNIVCYEDPERWILGKFARKLHEHLNAFGVEASLSRSPDKSADINHHIIYLDYDGLPHGVDTLMVTHIDTAGKLLQLKRQMKTAALAVCMSSSTVKQLLDAGLPAEKLCYVLPAQNEAIEPRKVVLGVATRVYQDGRKREGLLLKAADEISSEIFSFKIMGEGWDLIVGQLQAKGFDVEYIPAFNQEKYIGMLKSLDYFLYAGADEGAMGVVDALAAGVPVISTPQGYHLDVPGGLPFLFESEQDLIGICKKIEAEKSQLRNAVGDWTWQDYTRKHIQLWEHLLGRPQSQAFSYRDGLCSLRCDGVNTTELKSRVAINSRAVKGSLKNWLGRFKSLFRPGGVKY